MQANVQRRQARRHWEAGRRADEKGRWSDAEREYRAAVRLAPHESLYWLGLAISLLEQDAPVQAEDAATRALNLKPDNLLAARPLARCLTTQNRHHEAADVYLRLPESVSRTAQVLMEQGELLLRAERWQEAISTYLECLRQDVRNSIAYQHMGLAFQHINHPRDAAVCFETAATIDKTGRVKILALSQLVQMLRQAAEWSDLARHTAALLQVLDDSDDDTASQIVPFTLMALPSSPQQQRRVGELRYRSLCRHVRPLPERSTRREGRLRIGYLSADFCNHATTHLVTELLELHDRSRFEIFLYCHSPEDRSHWQARVRAAAEHFRDVRHLSDHDVARQMRDDDLDIAIDLKGHTRDSRFEILARRPAPIQVGFLGYPGTTGADFLDYILGDPVVTPLAHAAHFSERIAQMPHSYQPNDSKRALPTAPSRAELGLPDDAVVLCCFNQVYKISPEMFDLWARILQAAPAAVLWQVIWNDQAAANLVREMQRRGVSPERLFFSPHVHAYENLARLRCADLMLDTWPCNAHTTASDALWCGVPLLTVPGDTFASRVGASLVSACGLPEMVCADAAAYVAKATALVNEPSTLRAAQRHLAENRHRLPLFDTRRYARDFDALLLRMWERHESGLPPEHLPACPADLNEPALSVAL